MERIIKTGKEVKNVPGSFVIEFCGTPMWQRFDKFIDPLGDLFTKSLGFNVLYKGNGIAGISSPFYERRTSEDILTLARISIDNLIARWNSGYNLFLNGSVFEELGYIDFYRKKNILTPTEADTYTNLLLLYADRVDLAILTLFSSQTVLREDPIISRIENAQNIPGDHPLKCLTFIPRTIMNPASIAELNESLLSTLERHGSRFQKISVVDLRGVNTDFTDDKVSVPLAKSLQKALSRVYPIPPNIFQFQTFPRTNYKPRPPLIDQTPRGQQKI